VVVAVEQEVMAHLVGLADQAVALHVEMVLEGLEFQVKVSKAEMAHMGQFHLILEQVVVVLEQ
jgi:hypothetical protein